MNFVAESERLLLRPISPTDWPVFRDYALSDRAKLSMGADGIGAAWKNFAFLIGHQQLRGFAPQAIIVRGGEDRAIGMAGPFFPPDWPEPELGWQIWDGTHEGKGFAYEAVVTARKWSAESFGWRRMVSYIKDENTRSIRLAERLGCCLDETAQRRPDGSPVWRHPE
jgi:RimJ/RimL family protein N-acetyltransferase